MIAQSTQDQYRMYFLLVLEHLDFDLKVSIPTTSQSFKDLQSASFGALRPVVHLYFPLSRHESNTKSQKPVPLHNAFPSLNHPVDLQPHLTTAISSANTDYMCEKNPSVAMTRNLNSIQDFITLCRPTLWFVLYQ